MKNSLILQLLKIMMKKKLIFNWINPLIKLKLNYYIDVL